MKLIRLTAMSVILALTACGTPNPGGEPVSMPTATLLPPASETDRPIPTTAMPPSPTQVPPAATQAPQRVQIVLIAVDDQGVSGKPVGCGDSAVPVQVEIPPTQGVLKAALQALFSLKVQYYGESGLYNALYQSDLQVESVTIKDGKATIQLSGTLQLGGECDNPRVAAQLEETARQFSTVSEVAIFLNGKPLSEALSLRE